MSEYPRTDIDKALLKFTLQDCKLSQIVSVIFSAFFLNFDRQMLPKMGAKVSFIACLEAGVSLPAHSPAKLTRRLSPLFCVIAPRKKLPVFFSGNFSFLKNFAGHFFFTNG